MNVIRSNKLALLALLALLVVAPTFAGETVQEQRDYCASEKGLDVSKITGALYGQWSDGTVTLNHTLFILQEEGGELKAFYANGKAEGWKVQPDCFYVVGQVTSTGYELPLFKGRTAVYTKNGSGGYDGVYKIPSYGNTLGHFDPQPSAVYAGM